MTAENNRKYIAEAWVNNGEEEEYKKSFLKSLLHQAEGHMNGFDADTIDGLHLYQIEELISEAIKYFITSFNIGNTLISGGGIKYYLGFEAIKLYNTEGDEVEDKYKTLPWVDNQYNEENPYNQENITPDLHNVICDLYNLTYMGDPEEDSGKSNKNLYESFKSRIESLENDLEVLEVLDITPDGFLNAQTVNGIRFFIYNEEEYEDLVESAAEYDPQSQNNTEKSEQDYKKLHSPCNVFIIRDKQDLIDAGFPGGTYPGNPDIAVINKYYQFQITSKQVYNELTQTYESEKWLQYKYENEAEWKDMCKASDFVEDDSLRKVVLNTLKNNSDYTLNTEVIKNSLNDIAIDDESQIPMVVYNRQNFLKGGVYNFVNETEYTSLPIETIDNFQFLNLNPIQTLIDTKVGQEHASLEEYIQTNEGVLGGIKSNIQGVTNSISSLKGGSSKSIKNLEDNISELTSSIDRLSNQISSINSWEGPQYVYSKVPGLEPLKDTEYYTRCWTNRALKIVFFYFRFTHFHGTGDSGWKNPKPYQNKEYEYFVSQKPMSTVVFNTGHSPQMFLRIDVDGKVSVRTNFSSSTWHSVYGQGFYKYF